MLAQGGASPSSRSAGRTSSASKHAIAVSNGTVALMSIFAGWAWARATRSSPSPHVRNATVSAILFTGATPVFVDIEPDTWVIDAKRIEAAITPRTRAICPVHLFGLPPTWT
jgi:dTDP-4-amino-4,6-dideoxygalactose transaminase